MTTESARARPLGLVSLLALGVNGIVGVGIFFAPASVAAQIPGAAGVLVYLVTALALLPIAASYAALGGRFDVDGGPYVWADAAFGPTFAFFVGWLTFASSLFSIAAVVSGLAHHAAPLFGLGEGEGARALAVGFTVVLSLVAATGLRLSAMVWTAITALKLAPLLVLVVLGVLSLTAAAPSAVTGAHVVTAHGLERAVLVVVFASQGFEIVPLLAGSVRRAERSVPVATVASLVFATLLYAALHYLAARAVPSLGASPAPLAEAARVYGGEPAFGLVAMGANVSALGIAFGMLNTTPRYLSALAGPTALGPWIGELDARHVPQRALRITATTVVVMLAAAGRLTQLFVLSSLAVLAQYGAVLASLTALAWRRSHGLSRRHLWPVPLSALGIGLAVQGAEPREVVVAVTVVVIGEGLRRFAQRRG
jgi:basic amino acid/polyamine antiporter, APA family